MPDWAFTVMQLSPSSAYFSSIIALLPDLAARANADPAGTEAGVEVSTVEADPFFLSPEVGILVLVLWLVVPIVVGYVRFDAADL